MPLDCVLDCVKARCVLAASSKASMASRQESLVAYGLIVFLPFMLFWPLPFKRQSLAEQVAQVSPFQKRLVARKEVQYGERQRPGAYGGRLSRGHQVADAPRTVTIYPLRLRSRSSARTGCNAGWERP